MAAAVAGGGGKAGQKSERDRQGKNETIEHKNVQGTESAKIKTIKHSTENVRVAKTDWSKTKHVMPTFIHTFNLAFQISFLVPRSQN